MKANEFDEQNPGTTVGSNVVLSGTLKDVNDIIIFGRVEGEVISEKNVLIGESALIKGPVSAQTITVSGKINGDIVAHERLELTPTGKINGSISAKDLIIQSGAVFIGKCDMKDTESYTETKSQSGHKKEIEVESVKSEEEESKKEPAYEVEA